MRLADAATVCLYIASVAVAVAATGPGELLTASAGKRPSSPKLEALLAYREQSAFVMPANCGEHRTRLETVHRQERL